MVGFWMKTSLGFALIGSLAGALAQKVTLDNGVFTGFTDPTLNGGKVEKFLGIPFAKAPTGDLRFRLPVENAPYTGNYTVTEYGLSCPQQAISLPILTGIASEVVDFLANSIFGQVFPAGEDCLNINVVRPVGVSATAKLPVVVWIFGGGFQLGSPSMYDGAGIVYRSVQKGTPVIYVSMNYRVSAFGFLASKEVKNAGIGNLGLHDQRQALRWIKKYIPKFGGDSSKVTIWGESAGAISVALQMLHKDGDTEGLFRGGFMQSGSVIPAGDVTNGQKEYDNLVSRTGCSSASDTLQCLRQLPYATLKAGVDKSPGIFSYQSLNLAWLPRADGVFLSDLPQKMVQQGKIARIPFVTGDCDDEGTLFSLSTLNVTTDSQFSTYIRDTFLPKADAADVTAITNQYTSNVIAGSPFDTGLFNIVTPQFKRIASFFGDAVFQGPRRFLLEETSGKQKSWSFLSKRLKSVPVLGSTHFTDIVNIYFGGELADYLINFVVNLDPNGAGRPNWPEYTLAQRRQMTFLDGLIPTVLTSDDYRVEGIKQLTRVTLANPI